MMSFYYFQFQAAMSLYSNPTPHESNYPPHKSVCRLVIYNTNTLTCLAITIHRDMTDIA